MARKLENEELGAEVVMPSPLTGKHWDRHQKAMADYRQFGPISQSYHAALAIMESGHYRLDNGELAEIDENAPIAVLRWLGEATNEYVGDALGLSKN